MQSVLSLVINKHLFVTVYGHTTVSKYIMVQKPCFILTLEWIHKLYHYTCHHIYIVCRINHFAHHHHHHHHHPPHIPMIIVSGSPSCSFLFVSIFVARVKEARILHSRRWCHMWTWEAWRHCRIRTRWARHGCQLAFTQRGNIMFHRRKY